MEESHWDCCSASMVVFISKKEQQRGIDGYTTLDSMKTALPPSFEYCTALGGWYTYRISQD